MSVEIYDTSSESSLSSDEYEDEDDLMNMAVSSSGPNNHSSPSKSTKTVTSGDGTANKSDVKRPEFVPPRNRDQTAKQIMLLTKKKRLHQFYKNRSIKFINEKGKRQELSELLKERIRFRQINNARIMEINKIKELEEQTVAIARQELQKLKARQQLYSQQQQQQQQQQAAESAAAAESVQVQAAKHDQEDQPQVRDIIIAQKRQDLLTQQQLQQIQQEIQHQQRIQRTPPKSPELVCLDDTEGEETPEKKDKTPEKVQKEPFNLEQTTNEVHKIATDQVLDSAAAAATNEEVIVATVSEAVAHPVAEASESNLVDDATVAVDEVETVNAYRDEVQTIYTSMEVSADTSASKADVPMEVCVNACQETISTQIIDDDDEIKFLAPKAQPVNMEVDIAMPTTKDATNVATNSVKSEQPEQMPIKKRTPPPLPTTPTPTPKDTPPKAHMAKPAPAMQAQAMHAQAQAMQAPQMAHMQAPFLSNSVEPMVSTPVRDNKAQHLQQTQASNMSVKRRRSPTPELPPSVEQGTQTVPEVLKTITAEPKDEQKAKRPMFDPTSNAAFYNKIKDLLPAYEEAITVQVETATTTEEKLNEKIQRVNNDLKTLCDVLKTKEQEWNRLLYLKRVKEELLERLLRCKKVIKTTNRYDNLKNYSLKQLNELEAYLAEVRAEHMQQEYEPQPSSILTKLIKSRADMPTADVRAEIEKIQAFKERILNTEKVQEDGSTNKESDDSRTLRSDRTLKNNSKRQQDEQWRDLEERRALIDNQMKQLRYEREQQKQQDYLQQSQAERSLRQLTVQQQQQQRQFDDSYSQQQQQQQQQQRQHNSMQIDDTREVAPLPPTTTSANMGRQGAFKDVKSIIEDFRREHPEMLPPRLVKRANVAARPKSTVSNNNADNSNKQDGSSAYDGIPTLQKLLSGVGGNSYSQQQSSSQQQQQQQQQQREQHSGMAQITKTPIYRQNYAHSNSTPMCTSQVESMSAAYDKRQEDPLLNVLRNSIINGLESFNSNSTFTANGNGGQVGRSNGRICQECYRSEARFLCGGCSNQWYCSRSCQLNAWDKHHFICGV